MKCYNYRCDNILLEYREKKIVNGITANRFCIPCLKYSKMGSEPLRYKCNRRYCNNLVTYKNERYNQSRKYCSIICQRRNQFKTRDPEIRNCKICNGIFVSHLGIYQIYCGKKCRKLVIRCSFCKKIYEKRKSNQKYCSRICYKKGRKPKISHRNYIKNRKNILKTMRDKQPNINCKICNVIIGKAKQKYCSKQCYRVSLNQRRRKVK